MLREASIHTKISKSIDISTCLYSVSQFKFGHCNCFSVFKVECGLGRETSSLVHL